MFCRLACPSTVFSTVTKVFSVISSVVGELLYFLEVTIPEKCIFRFVDFVVLEILLYLYFGLFGLILFRLSFCRFREFCLTSCMKYDYSCF